MIADKTPLFLPVPTEDLDTRFDRVFKTALGKHLGDLDFIENGISYWEASAFGLDRVDDFNALDAHARERVLSRTSEDLMREACFIEMAGLSYTAKMSLSSARLEERLFYSLMAAEEAKHFSLLRPYISESVLALGPDPFTGLIGEIIDSAEREHAIFLVQVLLEGWGLNHFSWMAGACKNENLRAIFKTILRDEARHHAGGLALAKRTVTSADRRVVNWLKEILEMVRVGPLRLVNALEDVMASRSEESRRKILEQLEARAVTRERLLYLYTMISPCVDAKVMASLEAGGMFEPA
jgi:hypothetical protein